MTGRTHLFVGSPEEAAPLADHLGDATLLVASSPGEARPLLAGCDPSGVVLAPSLDTDDRDQVVTEVAGDVVVVWPADAGPSRDDVTVVPSADWPAGVSTALDARTDPPIEAAVTLERVSDAVYAVETDWRVTFWNSRIAERTGRPREEVVGEVLWDVFPQAVDSELYDRYRAAMRAQEPASFETYYEPGGYWTEVRLFPDENGLSVYSRDVSERKERERSLQRYRTLVETVGDGLYTTDEEGRFETVNEAFVELTGYPRTALVGADVSLVLDEADGSESRRLRERAAADPDRVITTENEIRTASGETVVCEARFTALPSDDGFRGTAGILRDVSRHHQFEEQLRALQQTSRDLIVAETDDEIGELAVEAAEDILGLPITGVWRYDADEELLRPLAETETSAELFDEAPTFGPGEALAWQVFEDGSVSVFDDVSRQADRYNSETVIRSEVIASLGRFGVMTSGTTDTAEFDEREIELFRILAASVEAALLRAERERQLREREAHLERQNERLDEFASVVAHDLRNPLSVATAYLDLVREGEEAAIEQVDTALDRIDRLTEDLLALARDGASVRDTAPVSVGDVAQDAWRTVEIRDAELVVDDAPTVRADRGQLRQLLENLLANAVEHGGSDVTVTVGRTDEGFFVADDGIGIPAEKRESVFEYGVSGETGTGIGLAIVANVAAAHGWAVEATESAAGGARFEFRTGGRHH